MCGIVGIVGRGTGSCSRGVLAAAIQTIAHRGPDGDGYHINQNVALAHRRLSIIDVESGSQPMSNEDGSVWVIFNGEIYNYVELRDDLRKRGHIFRTQCDTEVVVHAFEEWGEKCIERFNGMFAFAAYDEKTGDVFLARDRLGIKPLVYSVEPRRVAFASELQAIATLPDIDLQVDLEAIDQYLQLQYIPAPKTIYHNVYKLPPGHTLRITRDGQLVGPTRYWDVDFEPDNHISEHEWGEQLDSTIREAIRLRLRSDVPFGAFLSGGVDSSLVVAYMSELLDEPIRTFSIGFDEDDYSELPYARHAANRCKTDHYQEIVRPDALGILPDLVRHYGEPFGDSSAIPTFYVSRLARQHVKMVLSGDGGDENFAGYSQYASAAKSSRPYPYPKNPLRLARRLAADTARSFGVLPPRNTPIGLWLKRLTQIPESERRKLWRDTPVSFAKAPASILSCYNPQRRWELCSSLQYIDLKNYLPYAVLTKVDIASMYHGLEVRVPLLDHNVVELAARIPAHFKLHSNGSGEPEGKYILKNVAERFYDREFLNRRKMGFSMPLQHWFSGERFEEIRERIHDPQGRLSDIFQVGAIDRILDAQQERGRSSHKVWLLLFLSEWFKQHPKSSLPSSRVGELAVG